MILSYWALSLSLYYDWNCYRESASLIHERFPAQTHTPSGVTRIHSLTMTLPKVTLRVINQDRIFFADFSVNWQLSTDFHEILYGVANRTAKL